MRHVYTMSDVISVLTEIVESLPDEKDIFVADHTKLSNVCTCPRWGLVRYEAHKAMSDNARAMALEAGSAMHEFFAARRLIDLMYKEDIDSPRGALFLHHGERLFKERFVNMLDRIDDDDDFLTNALNFSLEALYTSGFYDDPSDPRRTMAKLEEAALIYHDRWDGLDKPVWIADENDPKSKIGIENPFILKVTFRLRGGEDLVVYYTGKLDGLHWSNKKKEKLVVQENKTGSRLNDAWQMSFHLSHQVTGYVVAAHAFAKQPIHRALVIGSQLPVPRTTAEALVREPYKRERHHIEGWLAWILETVQLIRDHRDKPWNAPMYTHSCNRYFRPCSFIPFCDSPEDEREDTFNTVLVNDEWSPLDE